MSIGLTMVRPGDLYRYAFKRAARALYHAKQSGRNGIVIGYWLLVIADGLKINSICDLNRLM